jgi:hypothetical protein
MVDSVELMMITQCPNKSLYFNSQSIRASVPCIHITMSAITASDIYGNKHLKD